MASRPALEGLSEGGLIDLARARLHHDDGVAGTGADEIKVTLVGLAVAEKPSSLSDEDQQTSPCRMVVAVVLQVSGQVAYTSASGRGGVT